MFGWPSKRKNHHSEWNRNVTDTAVTVDRRPLDNYTYDHVNRAFSHGNGVNIERQKQLGSFYTPMRRLYSIGPILPDCWDLSGIIESITRGDWQLRVDMKASNGWHHIWERR